MCAWHSHRNVSAVVNNGCWISVLQSSALIMGSYHHFIPSPPGDKYCWSQTCCCELNAPVFSAGGFATFSSCFPGLCEGKPAAILPMSISQPCLPVANVGPTRILPHLYLGSQKDVLNKVQPHCRDMSALSCLGEGWVVTPPAMKRVEVWGWAALARGLFRRLKSGQNLARGREEKGGILHF